MQTIRTPREFVGGPRLMAARYKETMEDIYPNKIIPKPIQQVIWYLIYCHKLILKGRLSCNSFYWTFFKRVWIYTTWVFGAFPCFPILPPSDMEFDFLYRLRVAMVPHPQTIFLKLDVFGHYMIWSLTQLKLKINRFVVTNLPYKSMLLALLSHNSRDQEHGYRSLILMKRARGGNERIKMSRHTLICKIMGLNPIWTQYPFCHVHDWPNSDGRDGMLCRKCVQHFEGSCLLKGKHYAFVQTHLFSAMQQHNRAKEEQIQI